MTTRDEARAAWEAARQASLLDEWESIPDEEKAAVPPEIFRSLDDYLRHHQETGGFLRCVLENDLMGAVGHAHPVSMRALENIVELLKYAPMSSYGSPAKVEHWLSLRKREEPKP